MLTRYLCAFDLFYQHKNSIDNKAFFRSQSLKDLVPNPNTKAEVIVNWPDESTRQGYNCHLHRGCLTGLALYDNLSDSIQCLNFLKYDSIQISIQYCLPKFNSRVREPLILLESLPDKRKNKQKKWGLS